MHSWCDCQRMMVSNQNAVHTDERRGWPVCSHTHWCQRLTTVLSACLTIPTLLLKDCRLLASSLGLQLQRLVNRWYCCCCCKTAAASASRLDCTVANIRQCARWHSWIYGWHINFYAITTMKTDFNRLKFPIAVADVIPSHRIDVMISTMYS
jgi:hypothetical protein